MLRKELAGILNELIRGNITVDQAVDKIGFEPFLETEHCLTLDLDRGIRTGISEVVFGTGKSREQLYSAVENLSRKQSPVLVTRLDHDSGQDLARKYPEGRYLEIPGIFVLNKQISLDDCWNGDAEAVIISAGGSDLPVALEAYATMVFFGHTPGLITDVGVAGLHRLFPHLPKIAKARILIVIAGMEGALPSVLAGITAAPIVAVPTSVGYGTNMGGFTPLLAMLTSCAPGISVVNIDNGFGAACFALKVLDSKPPKSESGPNE